MKKIHVLIVDDSAVIRQLLKEILSSDEEITVVGTAADPYIARDKIKKLNPDVITLDIEMPKMDGISFLSNLMRLRPMPVVMISSLTEAGADAALEALSLGAIDYVSKPREDIAEHLSEYSKEIISKVKAASSARLVYKDSAGDVSGISPKSAGDQDTHSQTVQLGGSDHQLIAIGASTGGTEAIKEILINLHSNTPGIVISQHIPRSFSAAFARRMDGVSPLSVCEAVAGQKIERGHVYISPGDRHLIVKKQLDGFCCLLDDGDPVNHHKPSVDVMFDSVVKAAGASAIGVLLTGMGVDGARCLGDLRSVGATTIAQDKESSVIWGMPGAAVKLDAADYVLSLADIPKKILYLLNKQHA